MSLRRGVLCLAVFSWAVGLQGADTVLPLKNGNFEQGLEGWALNASNPQVAQAIPEAASLGEKGLRLQSTPDCVKFDLQSTPLPVTVGKSYTVEFWSGGGGEHPGEGIGASMIFRDASGQELKPAMARIRKWPGVQIKGDGQFGNPLLAAAAPEGAVDLVIRLAASGRGPAGAVDVDDFKVTELSDEAPPAVPAGQGHPIPPSDPERVKALEAEVAANPTRGLPPPKIVIKLDDLKPAKGDGVHPRWLKVAAYAKEQGFKVAFGIIANTMVEDCPEFVRWVKEQHDAGLIEFWNHGWDHGERTVDGKRIQEFGGESYEYQKEHMTNANRLMREKMGFPFVSFGAPFNSTDEQTVKVLSEDPDIKVWMYGDSKNPAGKLVLERNYTVSIENPTFIPNYAAFLEGYAHNRGAKYFVMQGHPAGWDDERWEQFVKIITFLKAQKADFVFASDFVSKQN